MADGVPVSSTLPPSTIKSRPRYQGLQAVPTARHNLVAADGEGVRPVLRMLSGAPPGFAGRTHVLYAGSETSAAEDLDRLHSLGTAQVDVLPTSDDLIRALDGLLSTASMGTRLYAAGTEGFIGRVLTIAIGHGIDHKSVLTEHSGSRARRVQCVHCKRITEDVTVSIFECAGCGVLLFVRDHYSRRLAAFQGVCANAEDPSQRPVPEEAYP
ncbi:MAG: dimethylamine monooxygenase subunit [Nocardioidaceae bacterium]|nr:dimethylamine monooxygenase subunit [Nocardioidaceae bacterium]